MSVRAFAPADAGALGPGTQLVLDAEESHYLARVRRLRPGDALELFDGQGQVWLARLDALERGGKRARVAVDALRSERPQPPERLVLLGMPDVSATLEALTGASELGASELVLIRCERSQGRAPSPARIERVTRAAMRQCGRPVPLAIRGGDQPWTLTEGLAHRPDLPGVLAAPGAPRDLPPDLAQGGCRLLVGPEGGLSPTEAQAALTAGFEPLELGPWILRSPTALVALLAALRGSK